MSSWLVLLIKRSHQDNDAHDRSGLYDGRGSSCNPGINIAVGSGFLATLFNRRVIKKSLRDVRGHRLILVIAHYRGGLYDGHWSLR